jgi:hypothetical protein
VFVGNEQAEDIRRVASSFVLGGLQMEASLSLIGSEFETISMYLLQSLLGDCNVLWWSHLSTSWRNLMAPSSRSKWWKSSDRVKMTVLWNIAPCGLVEIDRRFRGAYCLHQGEVWSPWWWRQCASLKRRYTSTRLHGAVSQKGVVFIATALSTWSLTNLMSCFQSWKDNGHWLDISD